MFLTLITPIFKKEYADIIWVKAVMGSPKNINRIHWHFGAFLFSL